MLPYAMSRAFTLAFSSKEKLRDGIDKFFSETYFNRDISVDECIELIMGLVAESKVSDLVCIEQIMMRCAADKDIKERTA
jgi:hypothetical protein